MGWPEGVDDACHVGETKTVLGILCNAACSGLYLPLKTPKQVPVRTKGLVMDTPLHKFWETTILEMYRTANPRHMWVWESTQNAILQPWSGMGVLPGVATDYDKLYRRCESHAWKPVVHHAGAPADESTCNVRLGEVCRGVQVIVAAVSGEQGGAWGVANIEGEILWGTQ